ncbi:MAG: Electron transfer flavoprotein alpha/beta-subunit [Gammaproteobacteria bacterium]|nr:Electron transfer flavoprotein alpha/beta-subunit [Gammaproteobacteria bacterium]
MSGILIVAEQRRGELRPQSLELVTAAQLLRRAGDDVAVVSIGAASDGFAAALSVAGVDEVVTVKTAAAEFDPDTFEAALGALIAQRQPDVVLIPHSIDSFGYAAALAAKHGHGFATDVFEFRRVDGELVATRGGYGQKVAVEVDFPGRRTVILTVRGNAFKAPDQGTAAAGIETSSGSSRVTMFEAPTIVSRSNGREFIEPPAGDDVDMTAAEFILTIGRGIGEEAKVAQFRELADTIGATLGCSRPIADAGWLPKSRQVGQSGKTASACKLYIAMGVSGAIQHLAGMKHVSTIVAVNSDSGASIFGVAKYGIVGDIFEVAEELHRIFHARGAGSNGVGDARSAAPPDGRQEGGS